MKASTAFSVPELQWIIHITQLLGFIIFFLVVYFINFSFLIIYFGTLGELHVDNWSQIRQPQKPKPCIHPEQRFSTSSSRVSSPTVPQLHFSILNLQIPLRYLDVKYSPSSICPACWNYPKRRKLGMSYPPLKKTNISLPVLSYSLHVIYVKFW